MKYNQGKAMLACLLLSALTTVGALASTVKQLDIKALLHKDGSAQIVECWRIALDDEDAKTEWYVAHKLIDGQRIEGLTVEGFVPGHEGLTPFQTLDDWDIDASRKALGMDKT